MVAAKKDPARELLRHTAATVAYRGGKALRGAPDGFARFTAGESSRTPGQILSHICDLYDWALTIAKGKEVWKDTKPRGWNEDVARFFTSLAAFDEFLASGHKLAVSPATLFQGPVADSLAHIGQIAMLRRLAASPVRAENYARADIVIGRVGPEQTPPKREF